MLVGLGVASVLVLDRAGIHVDVQPRFGQDVADGVLDAGRHLVRLLQ
jgi:hypothetical protein